MYLNHEKNTMMLKTYHEDRIVYDDCQCQQRTDFVEHQNKYLAGDLKSVPVAPCVPVTPAILLPVVFHDAVGHNGVCAIAIQREKE